MVMRFITPLGFVVLVLSLAGCGSSGPTTVLSGSVTYKGESLPMGTIDFYDQGDKKIATAGISGGKYRVENLPVGSGKVGVKTPPPANTNAPGPTTGTTPPPPGTVMPTKSVSIPGTFADPAKSGLTYSIPKAGEHTQNIELK